MRIYECKTVNPYHSIKIFPMYNNITISTRKTKVPELYRFLPKIIVYVSSLFAFVYIIDVTTLSITSFHVRFRQVSLTTQH